RRYKEQPLDLLLHSVSAYARDLDPGSDRIVDAIDASVYQRAVDRRRRRDYRWKVAKPRSHRWLQDPKAVRGPGRRKLRCARIVPASERRRSDYCRRVDTGKSNRPSRRSINYAVAVNGGYRLTKAYPQPSAKRKVRPAADQRLQLRHSAVDAIVLVG